MNFKKFFEIAELRDADTSHIQWRWDSSSMKLYDFEVKGQHFSVTLQKTLSGFHKNAVTMWNVGFTGPEGHSLTGKAGFDSISVYSRVLLAIKKLMGEEQVDFLKFQPYEGEMELVYNRFIKRFLEPDPPVGYGMIQVGRDLYATKDWINKNRRKLPEKIDDIVQAAQDATSRRLAAVRSDKMSGKLAEFTDPMKADISHVNFTEVPEEFRLTRNPTYSYHYEFEGNKYYVIIEEQRFDNWMMMHPPVNLHGYGISFTGPKGTNPTNIAGPKASLIYKELMLGVRKWLETHDADFLSFVGAHPKMDLVYDMFYRRFLQKDYVRWNSKWLMNRKFLEKVAAEHPGKADMIQQSQDRARKDHDKYLKWVRDEAAKDRQTDLANRSEPSFLSRLSGMLSKRSPALGY